MGRAAGVALWRVVVGSLRSALLEWRGGLGLVCPDGGGAPQQA